MTATLHSTDHGYRADGAHLEPEIILPSQLGGDRSGAGLQPEKRLMLAVLEEAVASYQKHALATGRRQRAEFAEADAWFAANDLGWPFSFVNICGALDLEPSRIRHGLLAWRERLRGGLVAAVTTSPFRRVSGSRHKTTGRAPGVRPLKQVA